MLPKRFFSILENKYTWENTKNKGKTPNKLFTFSNRILFIFVNNSLSSKAEKCRKEKSLTCITSTNLYKWYRFSGSSVYNIKKIQHCNKQSKIRWPKNNMNKRIRFICYTAINSQLYKLILWKFKHEIYF